MPSQLSLLYCTFPDEDEAIQVSRELLDLSLIACANVLGNINSLYKWKGKLEESLEVAVLFKTPSEKVMEVIETIQSLHSYDTPAILEIPVGKSATAFTNWVHQEVMRS
jgi:periplasmic divalent cation tolerance protein